MTIGNIETGIAVRPKKGDRGGDQKKEDRKKEGKGDGLVRVGG